MVRCGCRRGGTLSGAIVGALTAAAVLLAGAAAVDVRRGTILVRAGASPSSRTIATRVAGPPTWVWTASGAAFASVAGFRVAGGVGAVLAAGVVLVVPTIVARRRRTNVSRLTQDQLADVNGDGKADIIEPNENGNIYVWTSTGSSFSNFSIWSHGARPDDHLADVNGETH